MINHHTFLLKKEIIEKGDNGGAKQKYERPMVVHILLMEKQPALWAVCFSLTPPQIWRMKNKNDLNIIKYL